MEMKGEIVSSHVSTENKEKIFAYASSKPLEVVAIFSATTAVADFAGKPVISQVRWHVINEAQQALLSKETAEQLKLLKVGVEVKSLCSTITSLKNDNIPNIQTKSPNDDSKKSKIFPKIPNFQLKFKVNPDIQPVRIPRVRIPAPLKEAVQKRLDEMQEAGIIEDAPYDTEWINPLEVVIKGKDDFRLVLDMRRPNEAIQRAHHPLPEVQLVLESVHGARFFTKLDLTSAFFHIELHKDSRNITSFMSPKGLKRYTRMVFGVNTAPEVFQREMENIFRDCEGTIIFIDDILVSAETLLDLAARVDKVKQRIIRNNLTLNEAKCEYNQKQINFLGMTLSASGFVPSPDKVEAIRDCKTPANVENLRSFMGLVTHLSNYIKDLATIGEPLRTLIRKNTKWQWTEKEEEAFNEIRKRICNDINDQAFYSVNLPTKLYTDASGVGLGAVMIQTQEDGIDKVVAYASKSLTETEKKYPQSQRESLAIVWAIERFSHFLLGKHFTLFTDNKASEYLFGNKDRTTTRAITRAEGWALRLSMYSFKVQAVQGKLNIADTLSRLCQPGDAPYLESEKNQEFSEIKLEINSIILKNPAEIVWENKQLIHENLLRKWENSHSLNSLYNTQQSIPWKDLVYESSRDECIKQIRDALITNNWSGAPSAFEKIKDELFMKGEVLIKGLQIVLPSKLRPNALNIVHLNHAGEAAMKRTLRDRVWWPGLDKDVEQKRLNCKACTQIGPKDPPPPMSRTTLPDKPWEYLAIDYFSAGEFNGKILSVTDYYSRYLVCLITTSESSDKTIEALDKLFHRLGYPRVIKADNGTGFTSKEFNSYCSEKNITLVHSIPYFPQQNGMAERSMQTIKKGLKIALLEKTNWKIALRNVEAAYNATVHSVTLKTPNEMFFQRKLRGGLPLLEKSEDFQDSEVRSRDKTEKQKGKDREDDARKARKSRIMTGDPVLIMITNPMSKLTPRFGSEVFTVTRINGSRVFIKGNDGVETERHSSQLKRWNAEVLDKPEKNEFEPTELTSSATAQPETTEPPEKRFKKPSPLSRKYETRARKTQ